jgi:hypothetical protein
MKSRLLSIAAASALAAVPVVGFATPASAAVQCGSWAEKTFATSGANTNVRAQVCIFKSGQFQHEAIVFLSWTNGGAGKFSNFDVTSRVERYDHVQWDNTCDRTANLNGSASGTASCSSGAYIVSGPPVTGDASVSYNIGSGNQTWDLPGSPSV